MPRKQPLPTPERAQAAAQRSLAAAESRREALTAQLCAVDADLAYWERILNAYDRKHPPELPICCYASACVLPLGHNQPHYDGIIHFAGKQPELGLPDADANNAAYEAKVRAQWASEDGSNRDVPYEPGSVCDRCGAMGASDYMGDMLCPKCSAGGLPAPTTPPISKEEAVDAVFQRAEERRLANLRVGNVSTATPAVLDNTTTVASPGRRIICHRQGCNHEHTYVKDGICYCSTEVGATA